MMDDLLERETKHVIVSAINFEAVLNNRMILGGSSDMDFLTLSWWAYYCYVDLSLSDMYRPIRKKINVWNYGIKEKKYGDDKEKSDCSGGKIAQTFAILVLCITILSSIGILVQRANICFSK